MNRKFKDFSPRALLWLKVNHPKAAAVYTPSKSAPVLRTTRGNKGPLRFQGILLQNMGTGLGKATRF